METTIVANVINIPALKFNKPCCLESTDDAWTHVNRELLFVIAFHVINAQVRLTYCFVTV